MKKIKVLVATDASFLASGYGIYAKELLSRMHNSGKYEVAEIGCYATVKNPEIKDIPWKFYPNAVDNTDSRYEAYKSSGNNQFGSWRFNRICAHFKPDIVCTWTDYWMYSYQETSPYRKYFSWVQMPMVDSAPQRTEWLYTYSNADCILPYTNWAKKVLSESCGNTINLFPKIANAGINPEEFYPLENKKDFQKQIFGMDCDIIGCVMRNQKRKLIPDNFLVFRKYLDRLIENNNIEQYNKSFLYCHTTYPEENGWDIPALLLEHRLLDKVFFSYVCRKCKYYFPSKFRNSITQCPNCKTISASFPNVASSIDTNVLNKIYNLFDYFIQNAIAEGFGMPQLEAAACGIPFASVDYSAMSEIVENLHGSKIPVKRMFRELETNADRAYGDNDVIVNLLYDFFINTNIEDKKELSEKIRKECINRYTWDNVYSVWDECLQSIDLSCNLSWDSKDVLSTNHQNMKVPQNLDPQEFVEYICLNVINDPNLINTANIQTLIKDVSSKLVARNGLIQSIDYSKAIEVLEAHLNNKIACETLRTQHLNENEDFLICHK